MDRHKQSSDENIQKIPRPLNNEDMHCPHCFSVMYIVKCHLYQIPVFIAL